MKHWLTYSRAVLAMFFWGITFVWYKIAFESYRPYEIVFMRLLLASLILMIVMLFSKNWQKPQGKDLYHFMLVAFFEPFLYFMGEANGMQYVSSSLGSIIIATIPIFAAVGAWLFLKEKLNAYVFIGIFLSILGVVIMSLGAGEIDATLKGIAFLAIAIVGAVGYGISVRPLTLRYSTLSIVAYQSFFGAVFFLPFFVIKDGSHFAAIEHTTRGLLTVAGMSLFASIGAFALYTDVIRVLGVAKANIFTNLIPVFTVVLAFFILGDAIGIRVILGLGLVLLGLILSQKKSRNVQKEENLEQENL